MMHLNDDRLLSVTHRLTLFNSCLHGSRDKLSVRGKSKSAESLLKIHHPPHAGKKNKLSFLIHS